MLEITDLTVRRKSFTLENITANIKPHSLTVILGKNGSGKSTLISAIDQSVNYEGTIKYLNKDLKTLTERERATIVSIMPQHLKSPPFSVNDLVSFGRNPYLDFAGRLNKLDVERINYALETTGAVNYKNKLVTQVSGGEKQLAYLAMALCQDARIMVLDEPTAFLDVDKENEFLNVLKNEVKTHKKTAIITMHNVTQALRYADSVMILNNGKLEFFGSKENAVSSGVIERIFNVTHSMVNGINVYLAK
ncbi:MAG: ABC transporter ATP-binding protein [Clostridia bacterium]|nr:ABC transporter ATP-binding protein [Clostridia bacterium]